VNEPWVDEVVARLRAAPTVGRSVVVPMVSREGDAWSLEIAHSLIASLSDAELADRVVQTDVLMRRQGLIR
jgi:hypothetical protein